MYTVLLLIALDRRSAAQDAGTSAERIRRGMGYVYNLDFVRADSIFDQLIQENPDHPQGYYFKASSCFYQIISGYLKEPYEERFHELNDRAVTVAGNYEDTDPTAGQFYRGTAYGNLARFHAMHGDLIKAFYYAKRSKNLHEEIISYRPDLYDAYLTVGIYHYYAAAIPRWMDAVAGLFGLGGNKELGIKQIETVFEKGDLGRIEAKFFLANVYYEEGDYERSSRFYKELSSDFKHNPFLFNQLGFLYFSMDEFQKAEDAFSEVLQITSQRTLASRMFADYFLGRISKLKNDYSSALQYLNEAVDIGKKVTLFKSIDAWIVGAAYYQAAETMELARDRAASAELYELARNHPHAGRGTVQASKNRLQFGLSPFEISVIRSRHLILYGRTEEGRIAMEALLPLAKNGQQKFLSQIYFYLGRAAWAGSDFDKARMYFQEALRTQTDDGDQKWREPQARYFLGVCYLRLGQKGSAKEELSKVLEFDQYLEAARFKFLARSHLKNL